MQKTQKKSVNREYKDRLFKLIFREKKDLLELYNAINDTDYDNPEDIEVNTLEDVVYMGMKNDVSFLITDVLNLYEHQSTFSPNLPLRGLLYFIMGQRKNQSVRCFVYVISFPEWSNKEEALQCQAVVLNINLGYNSDIMKKCKKLQEYAQFIACVRDYLAKGMAIEEAIDTAVNVCIRNGILEELLRKHREEVCAVLLTEYDEQAHIESEREIALQEGEAIGLKKGEKRVAQLIQYLTRDGRREDMERALEDEEYRERLYREYQL